MTYYMLSRMLNPTHSLTHYGTAPGARTGLWCLKNCRTIVSITISSIFVFLES